MLLCVICFCLFLTIDETIQHNVLKSRNMLSTGSIHLSDCTVILGRAKGTALDIVRKGNIISESLSQALHLSMLKFLGEKEKSTNAVPGSPFVSLSGPFVCCELESTNSPNAGKTRCRF